MAQIDHFIVESVSANDLLCELQDLHSCMVEIEDYLTDQTMHRYAPYRILLVDTDGRETPICTVSLP